MELRNCARFPLPPAGRFLLHQRLCVTLKEEYDGHQRCSEVTNRELRREFEDSSLATEALEAKIQVSIQ